MYHMRDQIPPSPRFETHVTITKKVTEIYTVRANGPGAVYGASPGQERSGGLRCTWTTLDAVLPMLITSAWLLR